MLPVTSAPPPLPPPRRVVLPLLDSRRESPSVMTFRFSTEGSGFHYLSNQAVRLALPGVNDPWGAVRTFSLSSSPSERDHIAVTCKITDTPFKQALSRLRPGDPAEVHGPLGAFLFNGTRPSVYLAGGIGISPFRGMLRYAEDTGNAVPKRLLYSARVPEELVFRGELDRIALRSPQLRVQVQCHASHRVHGALGGPGRANLCGVDPRGRGATGPTTLLCRRATGDGRRGRGDPRTHPGNPGRRHRLRDVPRLLSPARAPSHQVQFTDGSSTPPRSPRQGAEDG